MDKSDIARLAEVVDRAAVDRAPVAQLSSHASMDVAQAYEVQRASVDRRHQRGEKKIGIKLGFTSRPKMKQMGVDSIIWGPLTDAMIREDGGEVAIGDFIHPRVEPELCFITKRAIDRPLTLIELAGYIDGVAPAIEIIDSRYENFRFSLPDVIADNCSSSALVVGPWHACPDDVSNLGVILANGAEIAQTGSTAAVLGNPLRALAMASHLACQAGQTIAAGSLVMSGGATSAEPLSVGAHVRVKIAGLGGAEFVCI